MSSFKTSATLKLKLGKRWDDFHAFLLEQFDLIFRDLYARHGSTFASYKTHPNYSIKGLFNEDAQVQSALKQLRLELKDKYGLETRETLDIGPKVFRNALILFVYGGHDAKHTEANRLRQFRNSRPIVGGRRRATQAFIKEDEPETTS